MNKANNHNVSSILGEGVFQSALQTAAVVVIILSPDLIILEFNHEAEQLYGVTRQEVLGQNYFQRFLPEEAWEEVTADSQKVLAGAPTKGFENIVVAGGGQEPRKAVQNSTNAYKAKGYWLAAQG